MDWKSWKYKNLTILAASFLLSVFLGSFNPFKEFIFNMGLPAAFLAGIIFISTFAAPLAAITLLVLARQESLIQLWIVASFGAVLSDLLFFRMVKNNIATEIEPLYENIAGNSFHKILKTKHFRWLFPVIGTLIIFSPFPKEPGIHLLGIPKLTSRQFIMLSAAINLVGLAFILLLSFVIKP